MDDNPLLALELYVQTHKTISVSKDSVKNKHWAHKFDSFHLLSKVRTTLHSMTSSTT